MVLMNGHAKGRQQQEGQTERMVTLILRIGVTLSACVIAIGLLLLKLRGTSGYAPGIYPHHLLTIFFGVLAGRPYAIIMLGLILLILTPALRVAASIIGFRIEQDRLYVRITSIVLIILIVSFILGYAGV
ncbi:MAG: DUF1634 domain-containing protein [Sporolactobacillus sp.]|jgi:uncharacterized membrane protein|nr:DUF1634 domain-containing protein [Sporolactobacillus sp.]